MNKDYVIIYKGVLPDNFILSNLFTNYLFKDINVWVELILFILIFPIIMILVIMDIILTPLYIVIMISNLFTYPKKRKRKRKKKK